MLLETAMAFCEDCEKRATCKEVCDELEKHLKKECRAKYSVRAQLRKDMVFIGETEKVKAKWPRKWGHNASGDELICDD